MTARMLTIAVACLVGTIGRRAAASDDMSVARTWLASSTEGAEVFEAATAYTWNAPPTAEVVLAELPTVADGMPYRVVDLLNRQEILDELTAPTIPSDMKLLSWSGAEDAVLNDLREGPA